MNIPEMSGESSCKRQENGDGTGSERPLKKARFAWQVKGKYHLKNESNESSNISPVASNDTDTGAGISSDEDSNMSDPMGSTEQNLQILGDYLLKQEFKNLDSVMTDSSNPMLPNPDTLEEASKVSIYMNNSDTNIVKSSPNNEPLVPLSLVPLHCYSEDQCIAQWQAKQMRICLVDNTINRVLDSWLVSSLPSEIEEQDRPMALNVVEYINNLPGSASIENEGILMAISAHGLQNTSSLNHNNTNSREIPTDSLLQGIFLDSPSSSMDSESDEESHSSVICDSNGKQANTDSNPSSDVEIAWHDIKRSINRFQPVFPDTSNSSDQSDNENIPTVSTELDAEDGSANENYSIDNHDFLDAAVSFAIKAKGLTTFGTDYG